MVLNSRPFFVIRFSRNDVQFGVAQVTDLRPDNERTRDGPEERGDAVVEQTKEGEEKVER